MDEAILIEITLKPTDRSRGRHNPHAVKRKMSHFSTKSRAQPLLPPRQHLIYADHISIKTHRSYGVICWYGPKPIAPRIQSSGLAFDPSASRALRQPR